ITSSSRASSTWKASLIASTIRSSAKPTPQDSPQLGEVGREGRGRACIGVLEKQSDVRSRLGFRGSDSGPHRRGRFVLDRFVEIVAEDALTAQIALVPSEALVPDLLLDAFGIDVRAWIVRCRVRRGAIGDSFDERRAAARARAFHSFARGLVHSENVASVDTDAGHSVARRLVDQGLGMGLRGYRRRDRPLVVVAEED